MRPLVKSVVHFAAVATLALLIQPAFASDSIRTIAIEGELVDGATVAGFGAPVVNDRGDVLVPVAISTSEEGALLAARAGKSPALSVQAGQMLSGAAAPLSGYVMFPGLVFPHPPLIDASGNTSFASTLQNGDQVIAASVGVGGGEVISSQDLATVVGLPDIEVQSFVDVTMTANGQTAFMARLQGTGVTLSNAFGVFFDDAEAGVKLVAREGDPAPVGIAGVTLQFPSTYRNLWGMSLNDHGQSAFTALLAGAGVTSENNQAVFYQDLSGELRTLVRSGDAVNGSVEQDRLGNLSIPTINNQGDLLFIAQLAGPNVSRDREYGFFRRLAGGDIEPILIEGDDAPGLDPGTHFELDFVVLNELRTSPWERSFNGNGAAAILTRLGGPSVDTDNDLAIYLSTAAGELTLIAREGDPAPGRSDGALLTGFQPTFGESIALNNRGQVAFMASLSTGGNAIIAQDQYGELRTIASMGDVLNVSDDPTLPDLRIVSDLEFLGGTGSEDGRPNAFNRRGEIVFHASFTDGTSGVFVSRLVAVPSPSAACMWAAASVLWLGGGRLGRSRNRI